MKGKEKILHDNRVFQICEIYREELSIKCNKIEKLDCILQYDNIIINCIIKKMSPASESSIKNNNSNQLKYDIKLTKKSTT
jgi:hypothetical protein